VDTGAHTGVEGQLKIESFSFSFARQAGLNFSDICTFSAHSGSLDPPISAFEADRSK
jgi:hypothetical protein